MLSVFDMGSNFMGAIGNVLFLNQIKTAVRLEKWKKNNQETLPQLIENICEWETLISLTVFSINHPPFVFPEILENTASVIMEANDLGHPLIPEDKNVTNGITIYKNNILIITGANMAGKSTFLRTVGVNLLLAQTGAPVCASFFRCIPVSLFSGMRTIDNLESGISYFYAEALRIQQMLICAKSGKTFLLIMDELFRGTNSDDRLRSSLSFIRKLTGQSEISALIATHDLGITLLENEYPDKVINYCFECEQQEEQITFDYRLKKGITRSYNAYRLLQQMKIVD
jgi:DNA mismatch repair ATPase MutS